MAATPIPQKDLANLKEQLDRMPKDKDRVRLITAAADSFNFTCAQLKQLVGVQRFGDGKTQTAILIYPKLTDPQNFESVMKEYQFEEDKREIRDALGLSA